MWFGHYKDTIYLPHLASSWLNPSPLLSPDGSITNSPFHIIPILQPAIYSLADYCVADISNRLRKGPVNNRPRDSSLLSSTSSVWKPFLHVDTERQEVLCGGGCAPFSLWAGSKCAKELLHSFLGCYCYLHIHQTNTSSGQWWGYSQKSPAGVYAVLSRCGLHFWKNCI